MSANDNSNTVSEKAGFLLVGKNRDTGETIYFTSCFYHWVTENILIGNKDKSLSANHRFSGSAGNAANSKPGNIAFAGIDDVPKSAEFWRHVDPETGDIEFQGIVDVSLEMEIVDVSAEDLERASDAFQAMMKTKSSMVIQDIYGRKDVRTVVRTLEDAMSLRGRFNDVSNVDTEAFTLRLGGCLARMDKGGRGSLFHSILVPGQGVSLSDREDAYMKEVSFESERSMLEACQERCSDIDQVLKSGVLGSLPEDMNKEGLKIILLSHTVSREISEPADHFLRRLKDRMSSEVDNKRYVIDAVSKAMGETPKPKP